jgi:hypothetical protein
MIPRRCWRDRINGRTRPRHHRVGRSVGKQVSCQDRIGPRQPRGFAALDQDEAREMLAERPVGFIYGVGPASQENSHSVVSA